MLTGVLMDIHMRGYLGVDGYILYERVGGHI